MVTSRGRELDVPDYLKFRGKTFSKTLSVVNSTISKSGIATVCQEARCPNKTECWSGGTATFMLMGEVCTRGCRFCAVKTSDSPPPLNPDEPSLLAQALYDWELDYIVLTSVDRDDLPDGGAEHLAKCIKAVKDEHPDILIEILIPDFLGAMKSVRTIVESGPDVIAHNIETVRRLQSKVRDLRANYDQSLEVLRAIKSMKPSIFTKSSIMVGVGETDDEVLQTMEDLRSAKVSFLTIGQYMRPKLTNLSVKRYVDPPTFDRWKDEGLAMGFSYVASGPLVRSSYKAGEFFIKRIVGNEKS